MYLGTWGFIFMYRLRLQIASPTLYKIHVFYVDHISKTTGHRKKCCKYDGPEGVRSTMIEYVVLLVCIFFYGSRNPVGLCMPSTTFCIRVLAYKHIQCVLKTC